MKIIIAFLARLVGVAAHVPQAVKTGNKLVDAVNNFHSTIETVHADAVSTRDAAKVTLAVVSKDIADSEGVIAQAAALKAAVGPAL